MTALHPREGRASCREDVPLVALGEPVELSKDLLRRDVCHVLAAEAVPLEQAAVEPICERLEPPLGIREIGSERVVKGGVRGMRPAKGLLSARSVFARLRASERLWCGQTPIAFRRPEATSTTKVLRFLPTRRPKPAREFSRGCQRERSG